MNSARELREWLRVYPPEDHDVDVGGVDPVLRKRILGVLQWLVEDPDRSDALQGWMVSARIAEIDATDRPTP